MSKKKTSNEITVIHALEQMQETKHTKYQIDGENRRRAYIDSLDPRERINLDPEVKS